ncbi:MAG: DsbA family oxidoreductase, partial [Rhodoferax sp.]|nr:DsbA family oxidoreductase [Actinomycetota bacterium]
LQVLDQAWAASHPTLVMAGGTDDAACGPQGCEI